jgi:hypothetical protein
MMVATVMALESLMSLSRPCRSGDLALGTGHWDFYSDMSREAIKRGRGYHVRLSVTLMSSRLGVNFNVGFTLDSLDLHELVR